MRKSNSTQATRVAIFCNVSAGSTCTATVLAVCVNMTDSRCHSAIGWTEPREYDPPKGNAEYTT